MSTICNDCEYFHRVGSDVLGRPDPKKWICVMVHPILPLQKVSKSSEDPPTFIYKNGTICKEYRYGGPRPSRLEKVLDDDLV
jgi:hypothetical protein